MIDSRLQSLLRSLRQRIRRYVVLDSVLAVAAVILLAFWLGLAVDYLPVMLGGTEMPLLARVILLAIVSVLIVLILAKMLFGRLSRSLPDDSLALLVERQHPQLGGRLVTAVQLGEEGRTGDSHSPDLLSLVHEEAKQVIDEVDPNRVFRWQPLMRKAAVAIPLLIALIAFAVLSPEAFARATGRLTLLSDEPWPRRAHLEMVGVELPVISASKEAPEESVRMDFEDRTIRLPKGSSPMLRIRAAAEGDAVVPSVCTLHYEGDDGTRGQANLRRVGRVRDGFQGFVLDGPPLAELSQSISFMVTGLDDRLSDYRIVAVNPPSISTAGLVIRYPDYLRNSDDDQPDLEIDYQSGLRIREGSEVILQGKASGPLGDIDVVYEVDGVEQPFESVQWSEDRSEFSLPFSDFEQPLAVRIVPRDSGGISSQAPYRYFLGAVLDQPPEVTLNLSGISGAVTPIARLPMRVSAADDYGVENVDVVVASQTSNAAEDEANSESEMGGVATANPELGRDNAAELVMDLRELIASGELPPLEKGQSISVYAEATDAYDLDGTHVSASELFRLQIVSPEELLALMERRELGLRARLEQTITETTQLRETLSGMQLGGLEIDESITDEKERLREIQIRKLRVQQAGLQASKTSDELTGIAESLDDLLQEMINNRVDSVDRRERIGNNVRDPLREIVSGSMNRLIEQIAQVEGSVDSPNSASEKAAQAVGTADEVLLGLNAILDKMLDLESYNEILDIVRGLITDLDDVKEETQEERKRRVLDLFN